MTAIERSTRFFRDPAPGVVTEVGPPRPEAEQPVRQRLAALIQDSRITEDLFLTAQELLTDVIEPQPAKERLDDAETLLALAEAALQAAEVQRAGGSSSTSAEFVGMTEAEQEQTTANSIAAAEAARAVQPDDPDQAMIDFMHRAFRRNFE